MNGIGRLLIFPLAFVALISCGDGSSTGNGSGTEAIAGVTVEDAWARTSSSNASNGAVYMLLNSATDDAVLSASVAMSVAMSAEVHETTMAEDGSAGMRVVRSVPLPAAQTVSFEPGGYHIMLMGLVQPLAAGDIISVTLTLRSGGTVTVDAEVRDDAG
jgi:copper(I)-binding protein